MFGEMALLSAQPRVGHGRLRRARPICSRSGAQSLAVARRRARRGRRGAARVHARAPARQPDGDQRRCSGRSTGCSSAISLRRFTSHDVAPGTVVINEGEEGRGLFVVLSGELEVARRRRTARRCRSAALRTGDVFGEMSLLRGGAHHRDRDRAAARDRAVPGARVRRAHRRRRCPKSGAISKPWPRIARSTTSSCSARTTTPAGRAHPDLSDLYVRDGMDDQRPKTDEREAALRQDLCGCWCSSRSCCCGGTSAASRDADGDRRAEQADRIAAAVDRSRRHPGRPAGRRDCRRRSPRSSATRHRARAGRRHGARTSKLFRAHVEPGRARRDPRRCSQRDPEVEIAEPDAMMSLSPDERAPIAAAPVEPTDARASRTTRCTRSSGTSARSACPRRGSSPTATA